MSKRTISVTATVLVSVFVASGLVYATTRDITTQLGGVANDVFQLSGGLQVNRLKVVGTSFLTGGILNNSTTKGVDNPLILADNVRIDGRVFRGATAGPGDSKPFIINDDTEIKGTLTVGGVAGARHKVYTGSFDVNASGEEIKTDTDSVDCTNPLYATWSKYTYYHWKKIVVPELDLNSMPSIKVYTKLYEDFDIFPLSGNVWIEMSGYSLTAYTQGNVYILYKYVDQHCNGTLETTPYLTGEYKIVLDY